MCHAGQKPKLRRPGYPYSEAGAHSRLKLDSSRGKRAQKMFSSRNEVKTHPVKIWLFRNNWIKVKSQPLASPPFTFCAHSCECEVEEMVELVLEQNHPTCVYKCVSESECMCVCVCERERVRGKMGERREWQHNLRSYSPSLGSLACLTATWCASPPSLARCCRRSDAPQLN